MVKERERRSESDYNVPTNYNLKKKKLEKEEEEDAESLSDDALTFDSLSFSGAGADSSLRRRVAQRAYARNKVRLGGNPEQHRRFGRLPRHLRRTFRLSFSLRQGNHF